MTYLPVDRYGLIHCDDLEAAIRDDTILISVMTANNEIGTIEPIWGVGKIARKHGIAFHTDAVQAIGDIVIDVQELNIDMLSLSAHKFHGPKGVGALYVRHGIALEPLIHGGSQERHMRAGTENVPGIVGLGKAIELTGAADKSMPKRKHVTDLRNRFIRQILGTMDDTRLIGSDYTTNRLSNNANIYFPRIDSETLLLSLSLRGISASAGSACTAGEIEPSHVLLAIGMTPQEATHCIRFSFGDDMTEEDVDHICAVLREIDDMIFDSDAYL